MKIIGLTGGIGSGKSTVAKLFAERGFRIIDADQIARDVVEPGTPALAELADYFGDDILAEDGTLDRGLLASRAFADKDSTAKLNSITHPRINAETQRQFDKARDNEESAVIYDMPLLVDNGLDKDMDLTVVVHADEQLRIQRLTESRGLDSEDIRRRIAAQVDDETRNAAADILIDNSGELSDLDAQVDKAVEKISSFGD